MVRHLKPWVKPAAVIAACCIASGAVMAIPASSTESDPTTVQSTYTVAVTEYPMPHQETSLIIDLGECRLTVYTPESDGGRWGYQTATCTKSTHLLTCAVDPDVIPYYSTVTISGKGKEMSMIAVDCGNKVNGRHIDIFYDGTETEAHEWLMETFGDYAEVSIKMEVK